MKGKISKRLLSLILAVIMVVSVVPMGTIQVSAVDLTGSAVKQHIEKYVGQTWPTKSCLNFVRTMFQQLGGVNSTACCAYKYSQSHIISTSMNNIPIGADVFFTNTNTVRCGNHYAGHIGIYIGNGYMVHASGGKVLKTKIDTYWWSSRFTGWGYHGGVNFIKDTPPPLPLPGTPAINYVEKYNAPVGKSVQISWTAASNAAGYAVSINGGEKINVGATTTYPLELKEAKTYSISIIAYNSEGKYGSWSSSVSVTAHAPSTVTFLDWDGKQLGKFEVPYGGNATAPAIPYREGYTFRQWSDSYHNVTSDKTITAIYKINTYTVNFRGYKGEIIDTQRVEYNNNATPPSDTQTPDGYIFLGWNSKEYENVYTEDASKTIDIQGIYQWANKDLPIVCTITSAKRQDDGYYVYFDLENKIDKAQKGRAVVALKTSSGKLVDMTESAAFSVSANGSKNNMEVFIPSSSAASKVEIIIVADYATGVPISPLSTCTTIYNADNWSDWTDGTAPAGSQSESRTLYRYRDKEFSTGNTKTKDGWEYTGVRNETLVNHTGFQDTKLTTYNNETGRCDWVNTRTVPIYGWGKEYVYYHYYNPSGTYNGSKTHYWCPTHHGAETDYGVAVANKWSYHSISRNSPLTDWGASSCSSGKRKYKSQDCPYCSSNTANDYWFLNNGYPKDVQIVVSNKEQYDYKIYEYSYNFYRWLDWSEWSTDEVVKTDNREIASKNQYRIMGTDAGSENDTGTWYAQPVDLPASLAKKQVTLSVYGYIGASDYTNFYIGQQVLDDNGDCTFKFKLREELSIKTGDLTVAIGVEGTDYMQIIDILEAPKPKYTVKFYDWYGNVISEQTVTEGEDAVLPETPEKEGYTFTGWDKSITNIKADTEIYADYEKKVYTVVFVDWQNQLLEIQKYEHGAVLVAPEIDSIKGYTFNGWDKINDGKIIVTQDMVVYAEHEIKEYTVKFYDFDGNVIDTQVVKYGDDAEEPEVPDGENGEKFAAWFNPEDYQHVDGDVEIYPSFYFDETTPIPDANYTSGEYDSAITLTLTTPDENAVIYYYFGDDQSTEAIYTGPISIDKTTTVTYYATSFGKNDSEAYTEYYCINSDDVSGWMLQSELPANVTANPDDYVVESAKGYKYKNTQTTASVSEYKTLMSNGWKWESTKWTEYTAWQDEVIPVDSTLLGFEVDTQEVDDTSVTWYQYSHYKYTQNGVVKYSPTEVDGYECTYETTVSPTRITPYDIYEDGMNFIFEIDGQDWFGETNVPGRKTQYRSRYKIGTYYKWTDWGTTAPTFGETRAYETNTIYRYSVQNYHIVDIIDGFGDMPITSLVKHGSVIDTSSLETEGYIFNGLYTDEALTTAFGATTPVTERLTLYAKYTPKTYTVTFKGPNGYNFGSQQVEYLTAAKEPATFSFANWVFVGWDKDFDCITEDTVVQGMYIAKSEYAYITLDRTSADMYQGTSFSLIPTITPSDLANEVIEWSTSDPSIATVDDKGNVTAVAAGEVTITATVVKSREKASCTISVAADKANFIVLKSDTYLGYDSLGYLRGVKLNTTTSALSREFTNVTLKYKNMSGTELGENSLIGTGSTIMLYNGSTLVDSKVAVVTGDMTGDGIINNRDVVMMNKYLLNKVEAQECQTIATDVNGDGYVNNKDAAMVARYMVGKENF